MSGVIFFISWWIGAAALIGGLERAEGLAATLGASFAFALASGMWYLAYRLSGYRSRAGLVVIALWGLILLGAFLDLGYYAKKPFFWISIALLAALVVRAGISEAHYNTSAEPTARP